MRAATVKRLGTLKGLRTSCEGLHAAKPRYAHAKGDPRPPRL